MTPPAHRAKFGGPTRATAAGTPPPEPARRQPQRGASDQILTRLRRGPATSHELARLVYGADGKEEIGRLMHIMRELRRRYQQPVTHDGERYRLGAGTTPDPEPESERSPAQAVYALLTTRANRTHCDCDAPATHVALFFSLTASQTTRYRNALPVCATCAADFIDAETIYTMEEAYALVDKPLPPAAEYRPNRGRPQTRTRRSAHGRRSAAEDPSGD